MLGHSLDNNDAYNKKKEKSQPKQSGKACAFIDPQMSKQRKPLKRYLSEWNTRTVELNDTYLGLEVGWLRLNDTTIPPQGITLRWDFGVYENTRQFGLFWFLCYFFNFPTPAGAYEFEITFEFPRLGPILNNHFLLKGDFDQFLDIVPNAPGYSIFCLRYFLFMVCYKEWTPVSNAIFWLHISLLILIF
jgi:hypothetical protein